MMGQNLTLGSKIVNVWDVYEQKKQVEKPKVLNHVESHQPVSQLEPKLIHPTANNHLGLSLLMVDLALSLLPFESHPRTKSHPHLDQSVMPLWTIVHNLTDS